MNIHIGCGYSAGKSWKNYEKIEIIKDEVNWIKKLKTMKLKRRFKTYL